MISFGRVGRKNAHATSDLVCNFLVRCTYSTIILLTLLHGYSSTTLARSTDLSESKLIHRYSDSAGDVIAIKEGADLDLSCPIDVPAEDMIISWTCEDEPASIRSSRIHVTDSGKLRIHSAKLGDSCNYRCEAANGFGTLSVVIRVVIVEKRLIDRMTRRPSRYEPSAWNNHDGLSQLQTNKADFRLPTMTEKSLGKPVDPEARVIAMKSDAVSSESEIDIQIEPSKVLVGKNLTFSLECRIKYAPHITAPQIIWLKEFMGQKPASLPDALEQSLILLDDVYYHWLNWPSSITLSEKSLSASSALLIRQSSYVHSGRYICLAGYPAVIQSLQHNQAGSRDLSAQDGSVTGSNEHTKSSLKYKIAHALVQVDDEEGRLRYQRVFQRAEDASFLGIAISTNPWVRNLAILLSIMVSMALLYKLIQFKRQWKDPMPTVVESSAQTGTSSVAPTGILERDLEIARAINQTDMPSNCCVSLDVVGKSVYNIDQKLLGRKLMILNDRKDIESSTDHVYSEIDINNDGKLSSTSNEPYYKEPKTKLSNDVCEG